MRLGTWEGIRTIGVAIMIRLLDWFSSDGISRVNSACSPFSMKTLVGVCRGSASDASSKERRRLSSII